MKRTAGDYLYQAFCLGMVLLGLLIGPLLLLLRLIANPSTGTLLPLVAIIMLMLPGYQLMRYYARVRADIDMREQQSRALMASKRQQELDRIDQTVSNNEPL